MSKDEMYGAKYQGYGFGFVVEEETTQISVEAEKLRELLSDVGVGGETVDRVASKLQDAHKLFVRAAKALTKGQKPCGDPEIGAGIALALACIHIVDDMGSRGLLDEVIDDVGKRMLSVSSIIMAVIDTEDEEK